MNEKVIYLEGRGDKGTVKRVVHPSRGHELTFPESDNNGIIEAATIQALSEIVKSYEESSSNSTSNDRGGNMKNESFDTLFKEIKDDMREREARTRNEIIEREKRFEKSLEKFAEDTKEREVRYMNTVEEIKKIVSDGENNRKSTRNAMWTLAITTIIGIAAMVITVVLAVS